MLHREQARFVCDYIDVLYDTFYVAIFGEVNVHSLGCLAQAGHAHDVACECYDEATTGIQLDILDVDFKSLYTAVAFGIGRE